MDLYDQVSYENSRHLTLRYSTSFGISSKFFATSVKPHIYAIYGLVRIADEIVDSYKGNDSNKQLDYLESEVHNALKNNFSSNLIVHAFAKTANTYGIDKKLIAPFFSSMRMDLEPKKYNDSMYKDYIYGSAEVVGLMCLRVFVDGNQMEYDRLKTGASALGSAYQKVNFLRDLAADYNVLGRLYFPGISFESFDEQAKQTIIKDIEQDFNVALPALYQLPKSCRKATLISYTYYNELLRMLKNTPAEVIKHKRVRVPSRKKLTLLISTIATRNTNNE